MHRDIVPRSFACDYKLVADILARVNDGFREHGCLQNTEGRQVRLQRLASQSIFGCPAFVKSVSIRYMTATWAECLILV